MEREITSQYSLDLGNELKDEYVFDKHRNIHESLPNDEFQIGHDMGGRNEVVGRNIIQHRAMVSTLDC